MKIEKVSLEEAEKRIFKWAKESRAYEEKRQAAFKALLSKFPMYSSDSLEGEKAWEKYDAEWNWDPLREPNPNKSYSKLSDFAEMNTPIAEDKQCCKNCLLPQFCIRRRYVSNDYYVCDMYKPSTPNFLSSDIEAILIDKKSESQEVSDYLNKYEKLLEHAKSSEKAVTQKIKPLPEEAIKKADDWHKKVEKVRDESTKCWEPSKTKLCGMDALTLNTEKLANVYKENECCPMTTLFGPIVKDSEKVDK